MNGEPWAALGTIRLRLIAATAAALAPVLILGAIQTGLAFHHERMQVRETLGSAAQRGAADARARMESADILLETLGPGSIGFACAQRLAEVRARIPGYENLIRFDKAGRVACAAGTVPIDPSRGGRPWFQQVRATGAMVITRDPGVAYANKPALMAVAPTYNAAGEFDGALAAIIALYSMEYMVADLGAGYCRFFAAFNLFVFSMTCLVMGDNLLLTFLGWEGVGLCSYLLIGYFYRRDAAVAAAKKAFIINRIGDLGFVLAIMATFVAFGTVEYSKLFEMIRAGVDASGQPLGESWAVKVIPFLIAIGAFFPVYTTVASALRHVDPQLVEAGRSFSLRGWSLFRTVQLPAVVPSVVAGLRLALAQAWLFLVAAELIASSMGLGFLLTDSHNSGRVDRIILSIVLLALLGTITNALLVLVEKYLLRRWV